MDPEPGRNARTAGLSRDTDEMNEHSWNKCFQLCSFFIIFGPKPQNREVIAHNFLITVKLSLAIF